MKDDINEIKYDLEVKRRQSFAKRQTELFLWVIVGVLISGRMLFYIMQGADIYDVMSKNYFELLGGILAVFFPIFYNLIFGMFPLESIRNKVGLRKLNAPTEFVENTNYIKKSGIENEQDDIEDLLSKETKAEGAEEFIANLVIGSRKLARGLYSRSGVYLMIGVLIAFSGLAFFYLQTTSLLKVEDPATLLITLAPKFGILFFIEFIALFFLKQYKSAMDEFRYYESLQRSREESLAILKMLKDSELKDHVFQMIEKTGFRSSSEKLENGQTTDLLESKKLNKDEMEIFSKILDIVGKR